MARTTNILSGQLDLYGEQSESWQEAHADATGCMDLEEIIAFGNFVFERIRHIDEEWTGELATANEYPAMVDARAVQRLYRNWAEQAGRNLKDAESFEQKGYVVEGVDRLRAAYHEARAVLSVSTDRLAESIRLAESGHARPMGEVRDELLGHNRRES